MVGTLFGLLEILIGIRRGLLECVLFWWRSCVRITVDYDCGTCGTGPEETEDTGADQSV